MKAQNRYIPPKARHWTRFLLGIGVSVPIALAPLLGKLRVPLFSALLDLIPNSIQGVVIPVSAAAMTLVAVRAEVDIPGKISQAERIKRFRKALLVCSLILTSFVLGYTLLVTRVEISGGDKFVSFVTGPFQPEAQPCIGKTSEECIGILTFRESTIDAYFGEKTIKFSSLLLEVLYVCFFCSLGVVVIRAIELRR